MQVSGAGGASGQEFGQGQATFAVGGQQWLAPAPGSPTSLAVKVALLNLAQDQAGAAGLTAAAALAVKGKGLQDHLNPTVGQDPKQAQFQPPQQME